MTALLAALGLLPMALSHEIGAETQRPLAIVGDRRFIHRDPFDLGRTSGAVCVLVLQHTFSACDQTLDIDIGSAQGVALDEITTRLYLVAHQHGEHTVCFDGIVDLHAQ